ncbi:hypothetical protein RvY_13113 [Ramazzottius varieornatus]|uniref:Uncharacterized protein n=1 Tax=Ramazzottius varieornatus TaxID=947166 RepID=A0A1D1VS58_RAMVA|nr:hypothetical protein RvY_13113 [Ramazzottius varieornatus]
MYITFVNEEGTYHDRMPHLSSVEKVMAKHVDADAEDQLEPGTRMTPDLLSNVASESSAKETGSVSNTSTSSSLRRAPIRMQTDNYMRLLVNKTKVGLQRQISTPTPSQFNKLEGETQLVSTVNTEDTEGGTERRRKKPEPAVRPYSSLRTAKTMSSFAPALSRAPSAADVEPNVWNTPPGRKPGYELKEEVRQIVPLPRVNSSVETSSTTTQVAPQDPATRSIRDMPLPIDEARLQATKDEVRKILFGPKLTNGTSSSSTKSNTTPPVDRRPPFVINGVPQTIPRVPSNIRKNTSMVGLSQANNSSSNLPRIASSTSKGDLKTTEKSSGLKTQPSQNTLAVPTFQLKPRVSELSLKELLEVPSHSNPEVEEELQRMLVAKSPVNTRHSFADRLSASMKNSNSLAHELEQAAKSHQLLSDVESEEDHSEQSLPPLLPMVSGGYRPVFNWNDEGIQSFSFLDKGRINNSSAVSITEEPTVHLSPQDIPRELPDYAKNLRLSDIREQLEDIQLTLKSLNENIASMGTKTRRGSRYTHEMSVANTAVKGPRDKSALKNLPEVETARMKSGQEKQRNSTSKSGQRFAHPVVDSSWNPTFDELEAYLSRMFRRGKASKTDLVRAQDRVKSLEKQLYRHSRDVRRYQEQQSESIAQLVKKHEKLQLLILGEEESNIHTEVFSDVELTLKAGASASTTQKSLSELKTDSPEPKQNILSKDPSRKSFREKVENAQPSAAVKPPVRVTILSMAATHPKLTSNLKDTGYSFPPRPREDRKVPY